MGYDNLAKTESSTIIRTIIDRLEKSLCYHAEISSLISSKINNLMGAIPQDGPPENKESSPSCALEELSRLLNRLDMQNMNLERQANRLKEII